MTILLVEDDLELGRALQAVLRADGFTTVWVRLAADALRQLDTLRCTALVLDVGLPDGDGLALLRALRERPGAPPVVLVTARHSLEERLAGFAAGADDYLVKPFDMEELLARLRAVLRRAHAPGGDDGVLAHGTLRLDERRRTVHCDGAEVALSRTEFALLRALLRAADRVVTRGELEDGALAAGAGQTLDVHMSNLRRKIGERRVRTVRGVGYMIGA